MIPLQLRISGFLSYRDPVDLNFNGIDLACISGQNGAGKSSLLDAITWSLFGEARGKSGEVINLNQEVKAAEVALTFKHEENIYRVQRTLPRAKSTVGISMSMLRRMSIIPSSPACGPKIPSAWNCSPPA